MQQDMVFGKKEKSQEECKRKWKVVAGAVVSRAFAPPPNSCTTHARERVQLAREGTYSGTSNKGQL